MFIIIILQAKTKLNGDQKLNCSDEKSFMEVSIPVAVTMVVDEIRSKMSEINDDSIKPSTCKWFFCTFKCGNTAVSEQQYNYMGNKLGHHNCNNQRCDKCQ